MPKCTFCAEQIGKGVGKLFVYANGKVAHFCSSKCEKHQFKLKRKALKTKWTKSYREEHKKG